MKSIDVSSFEVVRAGTSLTAAEPVDWSGLGKSLEKQEQHVFWLQPKNGKLDEQFPCVQVNDKMYLLSLKMEKLIFRHILLSRGFKNVEVIQDGLKKLRMPLRLYTEKKRSSLRFWVRACVKIAKYMSIFFI